MKIMIDNGTDVWSIAIEVDASRSFSQKINLQKCLTSLADCERKEGKQGLQGSLKTE